MNPFSPFYLQPRYVPRPIPQTEARPERSTQRRSAVFTSRPPAPIPTSHPNPPPNGMRFFDEQHRKWKDQGMFVRPSVHFLPIAIPEAKIQYEAERARLYQVDARSGNAARPRSGGAHPPASPLYYRPPESVPWPGNRDAIPASHFKERSATRS